MDNKITFKANIVTKMKGRHSVLESVAKNFEQKTKGQNGSLYIYRNRQESPNAVIISLNKLKDYYLCNYDDLLGNNIKNEKQVTKAYIDKVTTTFINIYKALSADLNFDQIKSNYEANIKSVKEAFYKNQKMLKKALANGDTDKINIYRFLTEQNQKRFLKLNVLYRKEKDEYSKALNKMADKEPYLEVWRDVVIEDLK